LVPLSANLKKTRWVPIVLTTEDAGFDSAEVLLDISVTSPSASNASTSAANSASGHAPDKMSEVYVYERSLDGSVDIGDNADSSNSTGVNNDYKLADYRRVLADCYEWLWMLGYSGHDPLSLDVSGERPFANAVSSANIISNNNSTNISCSGTNTSGSSSLATSTIPSFSNPALPTRSLSDEQTSSPIVIERALSADDLLDLQNTANPAPVNRGRRGSRIRRMNPISQPDSDDEVETDHPMMQSGGSSSSNLLDYDITSVSHVGRRIASVRLTPTIPQPSVPFPTLPLGARVSSICIDSDEEENEDHFPQPPGGGNGSKEGSRPISQDIQSLLHTSQTNTTSITTNGSNISKVRARTDFQYPLSWILDHIESLQQLIAELRLLLPVLRKRIKSEDYFRPSPLKKDREVQALPINLHYQLLGIRRHVNFTDIDNMNNSSQLPDVEVLHIVSLGALSPHMLGHKKGGLLSQEAALAAKKNAFLSLRDKYLQSTQSRHGKCISHIDSSYLQLQTLGQEVLQFESACVSVGHRRFYALSQALSLAVNAFLLKLNLVIAGKVPSAMAQRWLDHGFLMVFEGLLSVSGHERSMLEDTISALSGLKTFQIKITDFSKRNTRSVYVLLSY
jgi:hypothetical protein